LHGEITKGKGFQKMFQMMILGTIGAQFYMSFKLKHESKIKVLSFTQGGEYTDEIKKG
jgi:hypothetical protein